MDAVSLATSTHRVKLLRNRLIVAALISLKRKERATRKLVRLPKASRKERWLAFCDAFWGLMSPVIILGGMNIGDVANVANTLANCVQVVLCLAILSMPKVIPDIWKRSAFHVSDGVYRAWCVVGALVSAAFVYYECLEIQTQHVVGIFIYLAIACLYPLVRMKTHRVQIETSYEEV